MTALLRGRILLFTLCGLLLTVGYVAAASSLQETLMREQLNAVAAKDYAAFTQRGNRAFKEMLDSWTFDSIVMQHQARLSKGYKLEYLGMIKRLGMDEHVWRVLPDDYKYQLLGRLSLADNKVVGFMLE